MFVYSHVFDVLLYDHASSMHASLLAISPPGACWPCIVCDFVRQPSWGPRHSCNISSLVHLGPSNIQGVLAVLAYCRKRPLRRMVLYQVGSGESKALGNKLSPRGLDRVSTRQLVAMRSLSSQSNKIESLTPRRVRRRDALKHISGRFAARRDEPVIGSIRQHRYFQNGKV